MNLLAAQEASVGRTLYDGYCRGRWTLEALDHPSPFAPPGYQHRNLAREWAAANPAEAQALWQQALQKETPGSFNNPTPLRKGNPSQAAA